MLPAIFNLEVPAFNEWRHVELLRSSILNCLGVAFKQYDSIEGIAMVAGELMENAVKYGAWNDSNTARFSVYVNGGPQGLEVVVSNPVERRHAGSALKTLQNIMLFLESFPDAKSAYQARICAIANDATNVKESGLGLVRIAYEGNCHLDVHMTDDCTLAVRARTKFMQPSI